MLLLVLVIGSALGWTLHKVREQGIAVAALEKAGCWFHFVDGDPQTFLERLRRSCGEMDYRNVAAAIGRGSQVTDAELVHVEALTQLQRLFLDQTQVTDAGLAHLERLTELRELHLEETQVTDAGLAHVERLSRLVAHIYGAKH